MPYLKQATQEELKALKRKCWGGNCKKKAILKDWTGWQYCFKHWVSDYKYGRCHGLWRALKDTKIF